MSHTVRHKQRLLARVRRIAGQVNAIERALEHESECEQVMHLIAGARGAMAGLMAEVVEDHPRCICACVRRCGGFRSGNMRIAGGEIPWLGVDGSGHGYCRRIGDRQLVSLNDSVNSGHTYGHEYG